MLDEHLKNITLILEEVGERVEGNIYCDISATNLISAFTVKQSNLRELVKGQRKIVEIGFNAGHSALFMIDSNPDAEYLFFDLGFHRYTSKCFEYISKAFPGTKMSIVYGDSTVTVRQFIEANEGLKNTFDLIHIDGGHEKHVLDSDYNTSVDLVSADGAILVDDTEYSVVGNYVRELVSSGRAHRVENAPGFQETELHTLIRPSGQFRVLHSFTF
jgi:predicted O-methyltransferase YrrM